MYQYNHDLEPYRYLRRENYERMRHGCNAQGWLLLAYMAIMSGSVLLVGFLRGFFRAVGSVAQNGWADVTVTVEEIVFYSGWGYMLAGVIGIVLLLVWKKSAYFPRVLFKRNRPMKLWQFVQLLSLFMTVQLFYLLLSALGESLLNQVGLTSKSHTGYSADGWSMFIYSALVAPVTEELLFRGVVLRSFEGYGKKFAIVTSALLFGLFHGNLNQGLFAFSAGLVLAYVALEYHILWAVVLHIFNNLLIADTMSRLSRWLSPAWEKLLPLVVLGTFGLIAMASLGMNAQRIASYLRKEKNQPDCYKAFWSATGIIVLAVITLLIIVGDLISSITPI